MGLWGKKHPYSPLCCTIDVLLQLFHIGFKTENRAITWSHNCWSTQNRQQWLLSHCSPLCSSSVHRRLAQLALVLSYALRHSQLCFREWDGSQQYCRDPSISWIGSATLLVPTKEVWPKKLWPDVSFNSCMPVLINFVLASKLQKLWSQEG